MDIKHFDDSEWPYDTLSRFGLTREMMEDLPSSILADLTEGRRSPVLPVRIVEEDGTTVRAHARIRFIRSDDMSIGVLFYPELKEADLSTFTEEQQAKLREGQSILAETESGKGLSYLQIDDETRQVLSAPAAIIRQNMESLIPSIGFSKEEASALNNGDTVTFMIGEDEVMTIGVDLRERSGLRISDGDSEAWKRNVSNNMDRYSFGVFGCWLRDDTGNLEYISEEDYTDEIWDQQKKSAEKTIRGLHK